MTTLPKPIDGFHRIHYEEYEKIITPPFLFTVHTGHLPIERLHLPSRAYTALLKAGIETISQLGDIIRTEGLHSIKGVGRYCAEEIHSAYIRYHSPHKR